VGTIFRSRRVGPITALALGVLALGLGLANMALDLRTHQPGALVSDGTWLGFLLPGAVVGALLAARRPRNPLGWLLLAIVVLAAVPASDYAYLDYRMHHGTLPLGWVAVVFVGSWPVLLAGSAIFLWLFPDGRLPPGRWRGMAVVLIAAGVLVALAAWSSGVVAVAGHPIPVNASGSLAVKPAGAWAVIQKVAYVAVFASLLTWLAVQVPRYRRSGGERRQQLKWLYSGAACFVAGVLMPSSPQVLLALGALAMGVFPVCIGVAVLRYRLYEIDRIISRVISYTVVTAALGGVFAGLVVLATNVLPFKTPVAVAASTLAAAALFNPLRKRVQKTVDRRFNRARYNAEAVLAAFTARLRGTVDLDTVQGDLVDAVHYAFEPAHVSVWLTPTGQHESLGALPRHGST
jgi:hypothetical protein